MCHKNLMLKSLSRSCLKLFLVESLNIIPCSK
uniref:Uncharacterized protein n=1 Tax=Arundo donax TaxID=35708 RepID=A0A0A9AMC6_ARUDO